jgi:arylsulfatase A-like enzyme
MHDQHVVDEAIEAINTAKEPFCHFIHLNDAHWPYSPTAPFHKAVTERPTWQLAWNRAYTQQKMFDENNPTSPANSQKMAIMKDLYLGAVRQVDHHLENIFTNIPDKTLHNTVIVIFADHGDAFGEKNEVGHNAPIPEVTHVPMIIKDPTETIPQSRAEKTVQLIDLYPTLAELLDVEVPRTKATNLVKNDPSGLAFTHSGEPSTGDRFLEEYVVWRSPTDYVTWDYRNGEFAEFGQTDGLKQELEDHMSDLDYVPPESRDEMGEQSVRQLKDLGYLT